MIELENFIQGEQLEFIANEKTDLARDSESLFHETFDQMENVSPIGAELFYEFLHSPIAMQLAGLIWDHHHSPLANKGDLERDLAGRVFEELAFIHLQSKLKEHLRLLTPDETFQLFDYCHFPRIKSSNNQLNKGIAGITVPDGLIIRDAKKTWQVIGVCEYKLGEANLYHQKQIKAYTHRKGITSDLALSYQPWSKKLGGLVSAFNGNPETKPLQLHPQGKLIYGVPQDSTSSWPGKRIPIPLTKKEFGEVVHAFYRDCYN